jgi:hypothetical protein
VPTGLGVVGVQTLIGQLLQEDKERLKEFEKDKQVRRSTDDLEIVISNAVMLVHSRRMCPTSSPCSAP